MSWTPENIAKSDQQEQIVKDLKLKIWNGRGYAGNYNGKRLSIKHFYVCAKTQKHAIELCAKMGYDLTLREIREYWSIGCWGIFMLDVKPEAGVWVEMENKDEPVRMV